jgi:hypothetical protein
MGEIPTPEIREGCASTQRHPDPAADTAIVAAEAALTVSHTSGAVT